LLLIYVTHPLVIDVHHQEVIGLDRNFSALVVLEQALQGNDRFEQDAPNNLGKVDLNSNATLHAHSTNHRARGFLAHHCEPKTTTECGRVMAIKPAPNRRSLRSNEYWLHLPAQQARQENVLMMVKITGMRIKINNNFR
jgi:hypothetical protein